MNFLHKHITAIIGTLVIHAVLLLGLSTALIKNIPSKLDKRVEIILDFQEEEKIEVLDENDSNKAEGKVNDNNKNIAVNQSVAKKDRVDYTQFEQRANQEINSELNKLVKDVMDERHKDDLMDENILVEEDIPEDKPKEKVKPQFFDGPTNITYNLTNRHDVRLDVPVYMCEGNGTVTLQIGVNNKGYVIEIKLNKAKSSKNQCLIKAAKKALNRTRFNTVDGTIIQKGTIVYKFVAQ